MRSTTLWLGALMVALLILGVWLSVSTVALVVDSGGDWNARATYRMRFARLDGPLWLIVPMRAATALALIYTSVWWLATSGRSRGRDSDQQAHRRLASLQRKARRTATPIGDLAEPDEVQRLREGAARWRRYGRSLTRSGAGFRPSVVVVPLASLALVFVLGALTFFF